jgi:hypothetical protein
MAGISIAWIFNIFYAASSARHSIAEQAPKTCVIEGPKGEVATFPVRRCHLECVKAGNWEGVGAGGDMQLTKVFSMAFTAWLKEDTCICSFGGKDMVRFRAFTAQERQQCQNDEPLAKKRCWEAYMKGRSVELTKQAGAGGKPVLVSRFHLEEYRQAKFKVIKTCAACYGDECDSVALPTIFDGLSEDMLVLLNDFVEDADAGKAASGDLEMILEMLTEDEKEHLFRKETTLLTKKAKEIIRKMIQILQAMMSGNADEGRIELINRGAKDDSKDKQIMRLMIKILEEMMSGMADKEWIEVVHAIDQRARVTATSTSNATKLNGRATDEEKRAMQLDGKMMTILQAQMSGSEGKGRVGLANAIDQQMMNILLAQMWGMASRRSKERNERAKQIIGQMMNTLKAMMSGIKGKDRTYRRANDEDDRARQLVKQMMNILQAMMSGMVDEKSFELVSALDQPAQEDEMAKQIMGQMMNIIQAQTNGMAGRDRTELLNAIDKQMNLLEDQTSFMAEISNKNWDKKKAKQIIRQMMNVLQAMMSGKDGTELMNGRAKNENKKDEDENKDQIMRQMMNILQAMMSGMAAEENIELANAIDESAPVPLTDDFEMAKQIMRQTTNIIKAQTSGMVDKDKTKLVNDIDEQMMNTLQAQMSRNAPVRVTITSPAIKLNNRAKDADQKDMMRRMMKILEAMISGKPGKDEDAMISGKPGKYEDDKDKQIMRQMMHILRAMMSATEEREGTELVKAIDQPAPIPSTSTSAAIKVSSGAKHEDEMAKQIMRQMTNILGCLQDQMSGMGCKDNDKSEVVKAIDQRMMNILHAQMSGTDRDRTELVKTIDQPASVPVTWTTPAIKLNRRGKGEDEKAKEIMRHIDNHGELAVEPVKEWVKESAEEPTSVDDDEGDKSQMTNILRAQMVDMADNHESEVVMAMDQHAPDLETSTTGQHDDDCIKADGLSKETLEKVKHIYRKARDGDETAKEFVRQIQTIGA